MTISIRFCGAAGTVTGSCYWVRTGKWQFLVDCGLFQGTKTVKELNYGAFPFDPRKIDFVLLTHAHADHGAMIPKLIRQGFDGPVYATAASRDLLGYMLPDSGYIQEVEVERLNRRNQQRGRPTVEPIYTRKDAEAAIDQIRAIAFEKWLTPAKGVRARYWNAGHILGAASIELEIATEGETLRLLFSGDLGPENKLFHSGPDAPAGFDYVICESTYGGRQRAPVRPATRREILAREITEAMSRGGALVIPSFAVERTQELLLDIDYLMDKGEISSTAVFLDSPLAIRITSVFRAHLDELSDVETGDHPFENPRFHFTETVDESKAISRFAGRVIILAASGMCDAGRIRHHLKNHLWRSESTILLVGYQAEGTLGRLLEKGVRKVKIQGEEITVRAQVRSIDVYSGHADGAELVLWMQARQPVRQSVFLTHGSEESLAAFRDDLVKSGFDSQQIIIPNLDDEFELPLKGGAVRRPEVRPRLPSEAIGRPDWHNEYAELSLDIRSELESKTDAERKELLKRLKSALYTS